MDIGGILEDGVLRVSGSLSQGGWRVVIPLRRCDDGFDLRIGELLPGKIHGEAGLAEE
jgi:hypothetical protein